MSIILTTTITRPDLNTNFNFKNENQQNLTIWENSNVVEDQAYERGVSIGEPESNVSDDGLTNTTVETWSTIEEYLVYHREVFHNPDWLAAYYFNQVHKKSKNITEQITFQIT